MEITVRYFAAARAATGCDSSTAVVSANSTLGELESALVGLYPDLDAVLTRCSFLRDGAAFNDRSAELGECTTVDVLPPFAGG